jgi:hypothetical protein
MGIKWIVLYIDGKTIREYYRVLYQRGALALHCIAGSSASASASASARRSFLLRFTL